MTTPIRSTGPATAVRLVAQRELNTRLRTRSFFVGTAVIIVVIAGYLLLQSTLFADSDRSRVGLSGQSAGIAEQLTQTGRELGQEIETSTIGDVEQGRAQVESGDLDALVSGNSTDLAVLVKTELPEELKAALNGLSQSEVLNAELLRAGEDPAQVLSAVDSAQVKVSTIEPADPERGQRLVIGLVIVFLLYFSITTYGTLVAQGIVEEKSSRVVEILLATVRPWQLLLGKVIGLGLVGLVQLLIIGGAGLAMASATGVLTLSGVATSTLLWGLVWYLLGFFLYATVFAAAGSLVSRQEDAQSVLTPVTMVLVVGFVIGLNVLLQDPDGSATQILSLVPVLSPVLMPGRIAAGTVGSWEILLALVLTLATVAVFTWLGGKIYQNAVLRTGSRIKLTDALKG
ncbi:ABC transporter permease [Amycolatopsis antarctica]|uniref:ABC transporter permease n=1 Tax=Amycolatopsis antarctica TaxID=1854586 RepID=A0A263CWX1_9PSEU|nr:ABC transporter permease [Amycolatopsis antarctica]OZM70591.1 ABC transporter permease [Amycolatopsis antarctica]